MAEASCILPAEWAPQDAVMLTWPHAGTDWAKQLPETETVFLDLARAISRFESLLITCRDAAHRQAVRDKLEQAGVPASRCRLCCHASDDTWARDHGPLTVYREGRPQLLDFTFNGWGGKYPAERDNALTRALHAQGAFGDTPLVSLPFVLEGGSIDSDGAGTLLTTRACLLAPSRNPGHDQAAIERVLAQQLGARRVFWLRHGWLRGDDTDSHIDMLARFCDPVTIAFSHCEDEGDEHFAPLQALREELAALRTAGGGGYRLVPLPIPAPIHDREGRRLPASYANFLIINGAVLVPQYDDPADHTALSRLREVFPGREIIGIDCRPLIQQYGSLHCLTMQLPRGVLA